MTTSGRAIPVAAASHPPCLAEPNSSRRSSILTLQLGTSRLQSSIEDLSLLSLSFLTSDKSPFELRRRCANTLFGLVHKAGSGVQALAPAYPRIVSACAAQLKNVSSLLLTCQPTNFQILHKARPSQPPSSQRTDRASESQGMTRDASSLEHSAALYFPPASLPTSFC